MTRAAPPPGGREPAVPDVAAALEALVAIPSLSGGEARAVEALLQRWGPWADEAGRDAAGNAVLRFGQGPVAVTVLGHVDTVGGEVSVRREGRTLHGRGTVDAKGPLVTALHAAASARAATRSALTVRVVAAVEEEAESSRGARHAVATLPGPDLLVIAEPSGWARFAIGYKGRLRLSLRCERPHAHSAGAEASALDRLVRGCEHVLAWARESAATSERTFDAVQATILSLDGGDDGVRQHARATVGLRLPPAWSPDAAEARLRAMLGEELEVHRTSAERAARAPRDSRLTRVWRAAIRAAGGRARPVTKTGTSDVNVVAPAWPAPWLAYGPGDSGLDHAPDERLDLDELERAAAVFRGALERLASSAGARSA